MTQSKLQEVPSNIISDIEPRAIQNGANFIAEGFLFSVGASLIIAETWRSSRSQSKRREDVDDKIEEMEQRLNRLIGMVEALDEHVRSVGKDVQVETARWVLSLGFLRF
jgi:optic atrophy 3 protein